MSGYRSGNGRTKKMVHIREYTTKQRPTALHGTRSDMAAFNKRHYEFVAKVLHSTKPDVTIGSAHDELQMGQWESTCLAFLNHFKQDNPNFDRERFLAACKGDK